MKIKMILSKKHFLTIYLFLLFIIIPALSLSVVLNVPLELSTIQSAIDVSVDGDEIIGGILIFEDLKILEKTKKETAIRNDFLNNAIHNVSDFFLVVDRLERIQFFSKNISVL